MKLSIYVSALTIVGAGQALAFDTVTWNWDADVLSSVITSAVSELTIAPTGLQQVENDQLTLGDFAATSSTLGVTNDVVNLTGLSLDDVVRVNTSATSLGNSASLESDVSTQFDSSQVFGGLDLSLGTQLTGTLADVSLPGALLATASTIGVVNGTVDNTATAVANNLTANLTTSSDQDAFLIGNNIQTAYAVNTSTSLVDLISFNNVTGLGTLVDPGVSSVATSVGNNLSVTIDGLN